MASVIIWRKLAAAFLFVLGGASRPRLRGNELSLPVADGYRSLAYKVVGAMGWLVRRVAFK